MVPFRNKSWPYLDKMTELYPDGAGTSGGHSYIGDEEETLDQDVDDEPPFPEPYLIHQISISYFDNIGDPLNFNVELDQLLRLGQNFASSSPTVTDLHEFSQISPYFS
jgi:hypothetical protein